MKPLYLIRCLLTKDFYAQENKGQWGFTNKPKNAEIFNTKEKAIQKVSEFVAQGDLYEIVEAFIS